MDFLFCTVQFWVWARKEEACLNCLFSDRFLLQKQTVRSTTTMVARSSSTVFLPNLSLQSDSNWKGIGKTRNVPPRIRNKNGRKSAFTSLKWLFKKIVVFILFYIGKRMSPRKFFPAQAKVFRSAVFNPRGSAFTSRAKLPFKSMFFSYFPSLGKSFSYFLSLGKFFS